MADAGDNSGGGTAPFYWVAGPGGGLSGEWTVYNRTWIGYEIVDNITVTLTLILTPTLTLTLTLTRDHGDPPSG